MAINASALGPHQQALDGQVVLNWSCGRLGWGPALLLCGFLSISVSGAGKMATGDLHGARWQPPLVGIDVLTGLCVAA